MNRKAFTLMELMVVVLIIAILASIALPLYNASVDNQNNQRAKAIMQAINGGMERWSREYPDLHVPNDAVVFISNPPVGTACNYNGQSLTIEEFIKQMIACGYIPTYNYGTASHVDGDGAIDYRFRLQDPSTPTVYGAGFVAMEPKPGSKVGDKFCALTSGVCAYKAGFKSDGSVIDIYNN